MILSNKFYLITCDEFFIADDGLAYKSIYGLTIVRNFKDVFNYAAHHSHSNWFIEVGGKLTLPGCKVYSAIQTDTPPIPQKTNMVQTEGGVVFYNNIYFV